MQARFQQTPRPSSDQFLQSSGILERNFSHYMQFVFLILEGEQSGAFTYVWDIMPTLLDFAGVDHPETYMNRKLEPLRGKSLRPVLAGKAETVYGEEAFVGGVMQNGKWMRQGDYKAVTVAPPYGDGQWRLFDVVKDPGETNDLAAAKPELLAKLQEAWDEYAEEVGVILTE